nr:DUF4433 domain-containing protein [uncultured Serinicoccus sp.]
MTEPPVCWSQAAPVWHFTRIEHLSTIIDQGLLSDARAKDLGLMTVEVGNTDIKARRTCRQVPVEPGGVVADYAPFYFAPRSPMLYAIHRGNVSTYQEGCGRLLYLQTTIERLAGLALQIVLSDRNAVLDYAAFHELVPGNAPPEDFIDWEVMRARYWNNTPDEPARRERRMAECLVHGGVPWEAFTEVAASSSQVAHEARALLARHGIATPTTVRPNWYF